MNNRRVAVLMSLVIFFLLLELLPPWRYEYAFIETYKHICPAGYSFITRPPAVRAYSEMLGRCYTSDVPSHETIAVRKDASRLNWQRGILALMTVGLLLVLSAPKTRLNSVLGSLFLLSGLATLVLYAIYIQVAYY
jgi:hypothetical protein